MNTNDPLQNIPMAKYAPQNRARALVDDAFAEFEFHKKHLQPNHSINMVCLVGGAQYDVNQIGFDEDFVQITTSLDDGPPHSWMKLKCPVEQVSFAIIISEKKTPDEPLREIGFHTEMKTPKRLN